MRRPALTVLLAVAACAVAPAAAQAELTAIAPADGATATQGAPVAFTGAGGAYLTDVRISRTADVGADGLLIAPVATATSFVSGDAWSASWTPSGAGSFYWQARRSDCSVSPCVELRTAPRLLTVTYSPEAIRPAPALTAPKAGAKLTLPTSVQLSASDPHAEAIVFEASLSPQTNVDGTFAQPVFSKQPAESRYSAIVRYQPKVAGTHYWHAIRTGCRSYDWVYVGTVTLDTDCVSRRASETRALTVVMPAARLRFSAARSRAYRSGPLYFNLTCANPPCRVQVTGAFTGKGGRRLPHLSTTVDVPKYDRVHRSLRPSRRQQRRIAAVAARRGKVRLVLRASSSDRYGQIITSARGMTLRKPKPRKPPKPTDPEQLAAERAVGLRVAERYEVGEDRTSADCRRSDGRVQWKCTWSSGTIHESWGEHCLYHGEADASRTDYGWEIRLYDIGATCYE